MDKIIRLAVLLNEAKDIIDELQKEDSSFRVLQCDINSTRDEKASVLLAGTLDGLHVPYKREHIDSDAFCYEDSVMLGGIKFHAYTGDEENAKLAF